MYCVNTFPVQRFMSIAMLRDGEAFRISNTHRLAVKSWKAAIWETLFLRRSKFLIEALSLPPI